MSWRPGDRGWIGISVAAVVLLTTGTVAAQTSGERYEVGGGVRFVGPEALGRVDANETAPCMHWLALKLDSACG